MNKQNKIIQLKNINKSFGDRTILNNLDLSIYDESFLAIMGKSGSGKSTLLNIITGQQRADSGSVLIDNTEVTKIKDKNLSKLRLNFFGYINQNSLLFEEMTVWENILLPLRIAKKNKKIEYINKIEKNMDLLNIDYLKNQSIHQLSGGEKQRISIVRALSMQPCCLIADEPTGNLDKENSIIFLNLLKTIHKENKMATVLVTHDDFIASHCDEIYQLFNQKLN